MVQKIALNLYIGQKLRSKTTYLKENSKIKDKFSKKFSPRNRKKIFFGSKRGGVDLYTDKYVTKTHCELSLLYNMSS